jgi:dUTPase
MKVKYYIKKVDGLVVPKRANETDAGYDIVATSDPKIVGKVSAAVPNAYHNIDYVEYETNLYITPEHAVDFGGGLGITFSEFHTDTRPRSSISKYNLVLANSVGLIDRGYRNHILCRFKYIWQPENFRLEKDAFVGVLDLEKIYKKGDRIVQMLPTKTLDAEFFEVDNLPGEDRGGGFGSTGK